MPSEKEPQPRQPLAIRVAIALMALVALSGIAMIGNGLYIMARAELSKASQIRSTGHHLAQFRIIDPKDIERASEA